MNTFPIGGGGGAAGGAGAPLPLTGRASPSPTMATSVSLLARDALSDSAKTHRASLIAHVDREIEKKLEGIRPSSFETASAPITATEFMSGKEAKRFAHIVGDSFIGGRALEGSYLSDTTSWVTENLRAFCPEQTELVDDFAALQARSQKVSEMVNILASLKPTSSMDNSQILAEKARLLKSLADDFMREIKAMPVGQKVLLPGGWAEEPHGHWMLYEVIKTGDELYTFNVYNTGAGIESFHSMAYQAGKSLISPLTSFENIPLTTLFKESGDDSSLLRGLLEPQVAIRGSRDPGIYTNLIYKDILGFLTPFHSPKMTDLVTAQRSGTCGYSVLTAHLHLHMPLDKYKALQTRTKVQELKRAFALLQGEGLFEKSDKADDARLLLQKGAAFVMGRLAKNLRLTPPPLPESELLQMIADVRFIQKKLEEAGLATYAAAVTETSPALALTVPETKTSIEMKFVLPKQVDRVFEQPSILTTPFAAITTLDEMRACLETTLPTIKALAEDEIGRVGFISFVKALPSPETLATWDITFVDLQKLHQCLLDFTTKSSAAPYLATYTEKLAIFKLYALIHAAAVVLDTKAAASEGAAIMEGETKIAYVKLDRYRCGAQFAKDSDIPASLPSLRLAFRATTDEESRQADAIFGYFTHFNEGKAHDVIANLYPTAINYATYDYRKIGEAEHAYWEDLLVQPPFAAIKKEAETRARITGHEGRDTKFLSTRKLIGSELDPYKSLGLSHLELLRQAGHMASFFATIGSDQDLILGTDHNLTINRMGPSQLCAINHEAYPSVVASSLEFPSDEEASLGKNPSTGETLRASTTGHVAPHLILAHMAERVMDLADYNLYIRNIIYLFTPEHLAFITEDDSFIPIAEKLIAKAIDAFFITRQSNPNMQPLLLICDLALCLRMYTKKRVAPAVDDIINMLYKRAEEAATFDKSTHYFLAELSLKKELFAPTSTLEPAAFCALWMRYLSLEDNHGNGVYTRSTLRTQLAELVRQRLVEIDTKLSSCAAAELATFTKDLARHLGVSFHDIETISYKSPLTLEVKRKGLDREKIILGTGQIISSAISIKFTKTPKAAYDDKFTKMFGKGKTLFTATSVGSTFRHPGFEGEFLLNIHGNESFDPGGHTRGSVYARRTVPTREWPLYCSFPSWGFTQYRSPISVQRLLPAALWNGHLHWQAPNGDLFVCSASDNKPLYYVSPTSGRIALCENPKLSMRTLTEKSHPVLTRIENPEFIIPLVSSDDQLQSLSYPRLHLGGTEVSFTRVGEELVANFDDRYCIAKTPPERTAGWLENSLVLRHRTGGTSKVLVPLLSLKPSEDLTSAVKLAIPERPATHEKKTDKTIACALLTLEGDSLKSEDNKGLFFLALLEAQRKNYEKAASLLRSYSLIEPLDTEGKDILLHLIRHDDNNPNFAAVKLKALLIILHYKHTLITEIVEIRGETQPLLTAARLAMKHYLSGIDKVSATLRLEEHEFLEIHDHTREPLGTLWTHELGLSETPSPQDTLVSYSSVEHPLSLTHEESAFQASLYSSAVGYAVPISDDLKLIMRTGVLPTSLWLTKIGPEDWPGFLALYEYARTATLRERDTLCTQIRCFLEDNPEALAASYRYFLKTLLAALSSGETLAEAPKDGSSHKEINTFLLGYINKAVEWIKSSQKSIVPTKASLTSESRTPLSSRQHYLPRRKLLERGAIPLQLPSAVLSLVTLKTPLTVTATTQDLPPPHLWT